MKKLIFISLAIIAMMAVSCTTDYTNPAKLPETFWRCSTFTDPKMAVETEWMALIFESSTKVEFRIALKNGAFNIEIYTYKISGKTITLYMDGETLPVTTGTIDGKTITITDGDTKSTLVFTKE